MIRETVRYCGDSEASRESAFGADAAARAAGGWVVVSRIAEYSFGKPGLDLVVTYESASATSAGPYWVAASVPAAEEPALLRYLRRFLVFAGIPAWTIIAITTGAGLGGVPEQWQLPWLAASIAIQTAVALGLCLYVVQWRRLHILLRGVGIALLLLFVLGTYPLFLDYAAGHAP